MKKTKTTEDPKVVFESNRKKVFQLASRELKCKKYVFDNSQIEDSEEETTYTTHKSRTQFKKIFNSNDKLLNLITIHEMHSESECSETENVHASIITALTDMSKITYEEPDGNYF